jgi:hypothetical protein
MRPTASPPPTRRVGRPTRSRPRPARSEAGTAHERDDQRGGDADDDPDQEVVDMRPVVRRQVRDGEALCVQPAPAAEADEDHVADRGGHEARDQDREERRPERDAALDLIIPPTIGPPNSAEIAENEPALARTDCSRSPNAPGERHHHPHDRAERDHEVPGRRRAAERARQAVPQPALDVVHDGQEERGEKRRRNSDHGSEPDEPQVGAAAEGRRRLGHANVRR